jgi:antagonist of KipI
MSIRVLRAGMLTSVQDLGRFGYTHLGISPGGAADAVSFRLANMLVGNDENAPALEMTLIGGHFLFDSPVVAALTGADVSFQCGKKMPMWQTVELPAGAEINCGQMSNGVRSYLAIRGGISVAEELRSASTNFSGHFGGFSGRALKDGDLLTTGVTSARRVSQRLRRQPIDSLYAEGPLRITKGLQWDWFLEETHAMFLQGAFHVTQQSNRAGLRLSGPKLSARHSGELLTEGIPLGSIQVPPNGQPIVLFVDQQTTGGYPKIANVIAADLHRVGQLRPDEDVRFELVEMVTAVELLHKRELFIREAIEQ